MSTFTWSGSIDSAQFVDNSYDEWVLPDGASITVVDDLPAITTMSGTSNRIVTVAGSVSADRAAIAMAGTGHSLTFTTTAVISGEYGCALVDAGNGITNNGTINATFEGIASAVASTTIVNTGSIDADSYGVDLSGSSKNSLTNEVDGTIHGDLGGVTLGSGSKLTNRGSISGSVALHLSAASATVNVDGGMITGITIAISSTANKGTIVNSGTIEGNQAIDLDGADCKVTNSLDGVIKGSVTAVSFGSETGDSTLVNRGTIGGKGVSVSGAGGDTVVTNYGTILHGISLGGGDDTFINHGGKVNGVVDLQSGSDTYVIDDPSIRIFERNAGNRGDVDRVEASVTYMLGKNLEQLTLTGDLNIDATGNGLRNRLMGNSGKNHLTGGGGDDVFAFKPGGGRDVITDFSDHHDLIDLSGYKRIHDFSDIADHISRAPGGTLIQLNDHDTIKIEHVAPRLIDHSDFMF